MSSSTTGASPPRTTSAVKATGRKQLIIAGIVTEVCVAFPAMSALEAGYEVFVVTDASGTFAAASRYHVFATAKAQSIGRWDEAGLCKWIEGSL